MVAALTRSASASSCTEAAPSARRASMMRFCRSRRIMPPTITPIAQIHAQMDI